MFNINPKLLLFLFCQLLGLSLLAQQEAFYSVFWNNSSTYNPATTGEQSKFYGAINYRNQWNNLTTPGYPRSFSALFELNIDTINSAFGVNYSYDQLGIEKSKKVGLNYSYHINLTDKRKIGFGVGYTLSIKDFNNSNFIAIDDYTQDPSIPNENERLNFSDLNAGLSFLSERFRAGIGITQITESSGESMGLVFQNQMHLFTNASYDLLIGNDFKLIPQARFATDFTSRVYEGSLIAKYDNRYWIGASYRSEVAFGLLVGIDISEKVRLGYALDYYTNSTLDFNFGGAHEIVFALILD
jgi:type IX secretion system PorP/SprF family membrane protein